MRKVLLSAATVLLATVHTTLPTPAQAAIYKCADGEGGITYTSTPCQGTQTTDKVLRSSGKTANATNCQIANSFALEVAEDMRKGATADDAFNKYGGINALQPSTISIINYVYSHRLNLSTVPERIAQLSAVRCEASAYGDPTCDQFPLSFIKESGGCHAATNGQAVRASAEQMEESEYRRSENSEGPSHSARNSLSAVQAAPAVPNATTGLTRDQCISRIESEMGDIRDAMRERLSANQQNRLRENYRALRSQKRDC